MADKWLPIKGYEGLYEVSNTGKVRSLDRMVRNSSGNGTKLSPGKILKQSDVGNGYLRVDLCKNGEIKHFAVHRLVASSFVKNPENLPMVNHKDENKENNSAENLEWCTAKYNSNYGTRSKRISEKLSVSKCKPVAQYLDGILIAVFPSMIAAGHITDPGHIGACCNGKRKQAGGFKWAYAEEEI